ncbi:MAG: TldD/PmbA family protein [bacterium]
MFKQKGFNVDYSRMGEEIIERVCRSKGEEAEVYIKTFRAISVDVSKQKLENFNTPRKSGIGLRIFSQNRMGFAYSTGFDRESIERLIQQARNNASNGTPDECNSLPQVSKGKKSNKFFREDLYDEELTKIPVGIKIDKIREMEKKALAYDKRVSRVLRTSYGDSQYEIFIFNSRGLEAGYGGTHCSCGLVAVAEAKMVLKKGTREIQLGSDFAEKRKFAELPFSRLAENAARRAVSLLGAKRVKTQRAAVVFEPLVVSSFLRFIARGLSADSVQKKKSPFAKKKGKRIASKIVNIIDDGTMTGGVATSPFDDEGIPKRRTVLVKDGVLSTFLYDSYTARKDKVESSGNGLRGSFKALPSVEFTNFLLEKGRTKRKELIASINKGLYVMETMGMHTADPVSGDFSVGVSGLWIDRGEFSFPVHGVTIAGNILDLLNSIDAIGDDLEFYGSLGSPTIRISGLLISGE